MHASFIHNLLFVSKSCLLVGQFFSKNQVRELASEDDLADVQCFTTKQDATESILAMPQLLTTLAEAAATFH